MAPLEGHLRLVGGRDALTPAPTPAGVPGHDVQFYESEEFLIPTVTRFLADGVEAGQPLVVIATEPRRAAFAAALRDMGVDPDGAPGAPAPVWLDARQTIASFMDGATPNRELFFATVGGAFEKMLRERRYLVARAYGEMVDLLWKDGNIEGAITLEELWNGLAAKHSFTLLCAYSIGNFYKEAHSHGFARICAHHDRVLPTETYLEADDHMRLRQISILQQRAGALAAEIHHRRELEAALHDLIAQRRELEEMLRLREAELRQLTEGERRISS